MLSYYHEKYLDNNIASKIGGNFDFRLSQISLIITLYMQTNSYTF